MDGEHRRHRHDAMSNPMVNECKENGRTGDRAGVVAKAEVERWRGWGMREEVMVPVGKRRQWI